MKRFLIFLSIFSVSVLTARENPFVPLAEAPVAAVGPKAPVQAEGSTINFQRIRFIFSEAQVRIETRDRLKKDFAIPDPQRIILDFEADTDFRSRKHAASPLPFREVRLGSHKGYYRTVIELDRSASYAIEPFKYGYILTLKK